MYFLNKLDRFSLDLGTESGLEFLVFFVFFFFPAMSSAPFQCMFSLDRGVLKSVRPRAVAPLPLASGSHVCDRK